MTAGRTWRVTPPYFTAGFVEAADGIILEAAPIIGYLANKPKAWALAYCRRQGWSVEVIET